MRKKEQWTIEEYCNSHGLGDNEAKLFKEHLENILYDLTGHEGLDYADGLEGKIADLEEEISNLKSKVDNLYSENVDLAKERDALLSERDELKEEEKDGV